MRSLALTLAALAACHSSQPASSPTPASSSIRGAEIRAPRPSIERLVARPSALDAIEDADWGELWSPPPLATEMPPDPVVAFPSRPIVRGDALVLADLALVRGDAFDAASQYRALVDARDFAVARYARFQLARAYVMLGEHQNAEALFAKLAQAGDELAWPSIVALADLRASHVGATAALVELQPLADGRFELLSDHLVHTSSEKDAAALLLGKATRTRKCAYANQALTVDPDLDQNDVPGDCRSAIEMRRYLQTSAEARAVGRAYQSDMFAIGARWDALADATLRGAGDFDAWLGLAADALRVPTRDSSQRSMGSAVAASALRVAVELAWEQLPRNVTLRHRLLEVTSELDDGDRRLLQRLVDTAVVGHRLP